MIRSVILSVAMLMVFGCATKVAPAPTNVPTSQVEQTPANDGPQCKLRTRFLKVMKYPCAVAPEVALASCLQKRGNKLFVMCGVNRLDYVVETGIPVDSGAIPVASAR